MHSPQSSAAGSFDVSPLVQITEQTLTNALQRSKCWERMLGNTLPAIGRAAYLEQHWEGLRVLDAATQGLNLVEMQASLDALRSELGVLLDRVHATAQWRKHHVTMPSMLQFRRHINQLVEAGDTVALSAQVVVRIAAARACPAPGAPHEDALPAVRVVTTEVQEELFSEELSAAILMVLAHGSDVCRAYPEETANPACGVTAAAIRQALA